MSRYEDNISSFFVWLLILAVFLIPYRKPYINKSGFMLSPIFFYEEYKFMKVIEEYEDKYLGEPEDIESLELTCFDKSPKMLDKKSNLKTDKKKLEYYSWLGVPEHLKRDMIIQRRRLFFYRTCHNYICMDFYVYLPLCGVKEA